MSQLNSGFERLNDTDFLQKGREIVHALTTVPGSGYFASVIPTPASLATALDFYETTLLLGNAPGAASDREAARNATQAVLQAMAAGLENIASDRALLAHSGFDLRKIPVRDTSPTGMPENVSVKPTGLPGEAKLSAAAVPQAATYEARATQDLGVGPFTACAPATGIRGLHFAGLERGKDWYFQIRAIGPNGVGPWSDPAAMMVV